MSNKHSVWNATNGQEFIRAIRDDPAIISERWAGDHWTVTTSKGRATLCNSRREMPPSLRRKIAAGLVAIGLGCGILLCILPQLWQLGL